MQHQRAVLLHSSPEMHIWQRERKEKFGAKEDAVASQKAVAVN